MDIAYIEGDIGAYKATALQQTQNKTTGQKERKKLKEKRKVKPRTNLFTPSSYFTLRKNVDFGVDDPQYELTVVLCDNMDADYFTDEVCEELSKIPIQLKERLKEIVPDVQFVGVLEGGHFTSKVTPYHYHIMLSELSSEQITKIKNYCSSKFVKHSLEAIKNTVKYKKYICKKRDRSGHSCKLRKKPRHWIGKFLQKVIVCNLNVRSNIKKRSTVQLDTARMRVSIGFKFVFGSTLEKIQSGIPLNINKYKRTYRLNSRRSTLEDRERVPLQA